MQIAEPCAFSTVAMRAVLCSASANCTGCGSAASAAADDAVAAAVAVGDAPFASASIKASAAPVLISLFSRANGDFISVAGSRGRSTTCKTRVRVYGVSRASHGQLDQTERRSRFLVTASLLRVLAQSSQASSPYCAYRRGRCALVS